MLKAFMHRTMLLYEMANEREFVKQKTFLILGGSAEACLPKAKNGMEWVMCNKRPAMPQTRDNVVPVSFIDIFAGAGCLAH